MSAENSDVLPAGSVAVAEMTCPAGTGLGVWTEKDTVPLELVVTSAKVRYVSPCPYPDGSAVGLVKNSMR